MSNSKMMDTLKTVRQTAKKLKNQIELISSTFGTLSDQIESLESMVNNSDSPGLKRSYTDGPQSSGNTPEPPGKKKFKDADSGSSSDCAGWSGTPFNDPDAPSVYTDGCCFHNGKQGAVAGIGVYWGHENKNNVSERLGGRATNNRAEILAALKAVTQAKQMKMSNLVINTDSEFLINCITKWIKGWKKKGWKVSTGGPVANREELEELDGALEGINVKWVHVRGHQGVPGNEAADRLANAGARKKLE